MRRSHGELKVAEFDTRKAGVQVELVGGLEGRFRSWSEGYNTLDPLRLCRVHRGPQVERGEPEIIIFRIRNDLVVLGEVEV